jgi:hypothetical protein
VKDFPEYAKMDVWDTEKAQRAWIEGHCEASYDFIEARARDINSLNPSQRRRYFGLKR